VLFGFAALILALGLGFSVPHMHTHCYKVNYHTHGWMSSLHIHIFNHFDHITGKDQIVLLFVAPSVGNTNCFVHNQIIMDKMRTTALSAKVIYSPAKNNNIPH
jgi:hypothetical protein